MPRWSNRILLATTLALAGCGAAQEAITTDPTSPALPTTVGQTPQPTVAVQATAAQSTPTLVVSQPATTLPVTVAPATKVPAATEAPTLAPTTAAATATAPAATTAPTLAPTATKPAATAGTTPDGIAIRPDLPGKIAFQRDKQLFVYQPSTGAVNPLIENVDQLKWSHDGRQLAFVRGDALSVAQSDGSQPRVVATQSDIDQLEWSPDNTRLLFVRDFNEGASSEVWVVDLIAGSAKKIGEGTDGTWGPDSKKVAYVTTPKNEEDRRTELRLTNWQGENTWAPVHDLPANVPAMGIPNDKMDPQNYEHLLFSPFWSAAGDAIYVSSLVGTQVETDFGMIERANPYSGGSTFMAELTNVFETVPSPDRKVVMLVIGTARGDVYLKPQSIEGSADQYNWLATDEGFQNPASAWAPDSRALAYYQCQMEDPTACDLFARTPTGPVKLVPGVSGVLNEDNFPAPPLLDWAPGQ